MLMFYDYDNPAFGISDIAKYKTNYGGDARFVVGYAVEKDDAIVGLSTVAPNGKIDEFAKNAKIVHVDIDAASISRNIQVDIPIVADAREAMEAMLALGYKAAELKKIKKFFEGTTDTAENYIKSALKMLVK